MNLIGKGMTDNINHRKDFSMFQHINKTMFVIIFIIYINNQYHRNEFITVFNNMIVIFYKVFSDKMIQNDNIL